MSFGFGGPIRLCLGFKESLCLPLIIPGVWIITCGHWLRGIIAEGLAWTAVHPAGAMTLISRLLFTPEPTTLLTELEKQNMCFFSSRVLDKHEFAAMLEPHGEIFNKYAEMRCCNTKNQEDLEMYLEEIIFTDMLMYGVGSWDGNDAKYRANFFTHWQAGFVMELLSKDGVDVDPNYTYLGVSVFLRVAWLMSAALGWVVQAMTDVPPKLDQTADDPFHCKPEIPVVVPPTGAHGISPHSAEAAATIQVPPKRPHTEQLFYVPKPPLSAISPQRFPGADPESTDALIRTLSHNHIAWHIFFNCKELRKTAAWATVIAQGFIPHVGSVQYGAPDPPEKCDH
ncbi:hypothetical protein M404DRAFT_947907 [Pisolithus tinctorius Marx 270]|uniref:Uncharacterized protein n=1 Tax=Pisolithus tinctorius Marx 270 TaxID=870435 RepID=A0A0C3I8I3_PISTI|nr:hypothetical protein M404DRAFT_947907 [Pisolithus tinctorius Marx 270]